MHPHTVYDKILQPRTVSKYSMLKTKPDVDELKRQIQIKSKTTMPEQM